MAAGLAPYVDRVCSWVYALHVPARVSIEFVLISTFSLAGQFRFRSRRCFLLRVGRMEWQSGLPRLPSTLTPVCLGRSPAAAYSQLFLLSPIGVRDPSWHPGLPCMSTGFALGFTPLCPSTRQHMFCTFPAVGWRCWLAGRYA